jgi:hypothetical protein
MELFQLPSGSLVSHLYRPGVWRVVAPSTDLPDRVVIEPWDDAAAALLLSAEAYEIAAPRRLLRRIEPGRSVPAGHVGRQLVAV